MSLDLDAYLERIRARGGTGIRELHRAHVTAIPFENLDPYLGVPVDLDPDSLQAKLVDRRRGGYCFEQNLLFKAALEAAGFQVDPMLARVRYGSPSGTIRPRTHLLLRVRADGATWHADVGFGNGTPIEPLPFGPGPAHELDGWRFRVTEEGEELVLQTEEESQWRDVYSFVPEPVPLIDIETSNWFAATHPGSRFVTGLVVSRQRPDGTRISLSDWSGQLALTERTPEHRRIRRVTREAIPDLLETQFELPGFQVAADGTLRPSEMEPA
jgi:N-hydroxyarylamine O-acetyltransferase